MAGQEEASNKRSWLYMPEMTWPEIAAAIERGADTVIIVASAQEQHGPHLPMATDYFWGLELAGRVAQELKGRALVAPVIPFGLNEEMMGFPGTVSLKHDTLLAILRDMCHSYARHGFQHAVLLTSHEGNLQALASAERELADLPIAIMAFHDGATLMGSVYQAAADAGISVQIAGGHSGEFETSIMLASYPASVDMARAEAGVLVDLAREPDFFRQDLQKVTANGVIGDARAATAEQGARYWEQLTALTVRFIKQRLPPQRAGSASETKARSGEQSISRRRSRKVERRRSNDSP